MIVENGPFNSPSIFYNRSFSSRFINSVIALVAISIVYPILPVKTFYQPNYNQMYFWCQIDIFKSLQIVPEFLKCLADILKW